MQKITPEFLKSLPSKAEHAEGPVAWCHQCSRFHRRRAVCRLYLRRRKLAPGKWVYIWCH